MQRWAHRMLRAAARRGARARPHAGARRAAPAGRQPLSWLDTYALNTVSAARFVAKSEVRGWPLIGTIAARFGTFFLKRGSLPRRGAHGRRR